MADLIRDYLQFAGNLFLLVMALCVVVAGARWWGQRRVLPRVDKPGRYGTHRVPLSAPVRARVPADIWPEARRRAAANASLRRGHGGTDIGQAIREYRVAGHAAGGEEDA